jgi:hypothetical protein
LRHHKEFSEFIQLDQNDEVCEIGSAHDFLAGLLMDRIPSLNYLSIEPDPTNPDSRIEHIKGYAEDHLDQIANKRVIIHSHVLEHVYHPREFMKTLSQGMSIDSVMYVSFPNIQELLHQKGTNALNFEHTYFLTPEVFQTIANASQLVVTRQKEFEKHSYFMELRRKSNDIEQRIPSDRQSTVLFDQLWDELEEFVRGTLVRLEAKQIPTYLFGSHVFSQALYAKGLNQVPLSGVLDNASNKQGSRLYGTPLATYSPEVIRDMANVRVILRASHYQDEIREQLLALNDNVEIIE